MRPQYVALCTALGLDASSDSSLKALREPERVPAARLAALISSEALGAHGTFRGCLGGTWWTGASSATAADPNAGPDPMAFQRSGGLGRALRAKGVRSVVLGDLSAEWYLYSIAHDLARPWATSIQTNLERYYSEVVVERMVAMYAPVEDGLEREEAQERFGLMFADGQVHLPVRMLARDLRRGGVSVVRYAIEWAPAKAKLPHGALFLYRPRGTAADRALRVGHVTHGTDRSLWAFRVPVLDEEEADVARAWLDAVDNATRAAEEGDMPERGERELLVLAAEKKVGWGQDERWEEVMRLLDALLGEN